MREFRSSSGKAPEPHEFKFKLDGQEFGCLLRADGDSVMEWSEITAAAMESDADMESPAGTAIIAKFFKLMMPPEQYANFRRHMRAFGTPPSVLTEIMQALNDEMERLVESDAARPTGQSSASSSGPGTRDERTLQIASAAQDGDVVVAARPNRQARRAADQRQARAARASAG